ncbi:hypothetical protein D0D70_02000 [Vibrio parahaemolyticus]|uniref:Uncharacterized protein n=1 Tax=Vibrio parahaemolyticus TaxID=670 RepID=A0AA46L7D4_VIBPH|nr:hypothetical protein [Vibrio parahaemolyticus]EGR1575267.1 hypothetical protein [Vibrio parahaemolyticus]EGR3415398.1 hypothetical protein [Vibrio parahaemolyticus]TPA76122.1 hypothetical protein DXJ77_16520 [Vibrio parahaemolyticus]TXN17819.1 hypothetical protein FVP01_02175 [Vibrio parahaemolyticus]
MCTQRANQPTKHARQISDNFLIFKHQIFTSNHSHLLLCTLLQITLME